MLLFITLKASVAYATTTNQPVSDKTWGAAADTGHTGPHPTNTKCEPISWR